MKTTLTTTILLLFTQFCFAQDFWIELDFPEETTFSALAGNSEGWIFGASPKGVYVSFDNGLNWSNTSLSNSTYRIIVDNEDRIFATIYPNIYYSVDNSVSWNVIVCPSVGIMTLYVNNNTIVFGNWGSIYKSSDFGETWNQVLDFDIDGTVVNAIVEKNTDGVLFAGVTAFMGGGGVYRSLNNGDTWGLAGLHNKYISSLAISSSGVLFAGSRGDHEYGGGGVFRSEDNGITWEEVAYDVWVTSMAIDPFDVLYIGCTNENGGQGGVFRSIDNGESWELIVSGMGNYPNVDGLSIAPDGYLYAYGNYLYRSAEPIFSPNSIYEPEINEFKIFPNPFNDFVNIVLPSVLQNNSSINIMIYDNFGKSVFKQKFNGNNDITVNLSSLKSGLYYLAIELNGHRYTKTILKVSR
ncbi:MAG: T9SS type A sorting domain-containing protein [Bacteroidetes bacterium]|nr:T9SS type A sorting domain-containing protein [Bacteroidota bacterium]